MTRVFAGIYGCAEDATLLAARAAVGSGAGEALVSPPLAVAWAGRVAPAGPRTILLSGRLRNLPELAGELDVSPDDPDGVVALAFQRWGDVAFERLRGGFALLVWDAETTSGLLAVDQLGVGGLFLREAAGRLAFATEVRTLLGIIPRRPAPDPAAVAQWVADGQLNRGTTLYEGIRRLEGGTLVRLEHGGTRVETYWAPRYVAPARIGRDEAVAELRSSLTRSVKACLGDAGSAAVQVSGGLDSSIVAALARGLVSPDYDLTAYSLVHPEHPDIDESAYIEQLTSFVGLRCERLEVRSESALVAMLEFQLAWDLPPTTPMLAFNMPLLRRVAGDGVGVLLDGEGGDELLGCSEYVVADRIRRLNIPGAVSLARSLPGVGDDPGIRFLWAILREYGLRGAAPHALHRLPRRVLGGRRYAPAWLQPSSASAYVELRDDWAWKKLPGPRSWSYLADLLTAGRERMGVFDLLRRRAAVAGVENTHPLLEELDLVELVLRLPPELELDAVLTRPLAREAVHGMLPDAIRLRSDKVDFSGLLVDALSGPDRALVARLVGARDGELRAYVRPDVAADLLERPRERRSAAWARVVSRLAAAESWLRSQSDPEFPRRLLDEHTGS